MWDGLLATIFYVDDSYHGCGVFKRVLEWDIYCLYLFSFGNSFWVVFTGALT